MGDILHKTLKSYHEDNVWEDDEEHPDGPLWLLTPGEWADLPKGTIVESIWGKLAMKGRDEIEANTEYVYTIYGLRGHRE